MKNIITFRFKAEQAFDNLQIPGDFIVCDKLKQMIAEKRKLGRPLFYPSFPGLSEKYELQVHDCGGRGTSGKSKPTFSPLFRRI